MIFSYCQSMWVKHSIQILRGIKNSLKLVVVIQLSPVHLIEMQISTKFLPLHYVSVVMAL